MEVIVADAYDEAGTKSHWWCRGEDGTSLFVLEQYEDADAMLVHLHADPPARSDFFASIDIVDVRIYCDVTPEIKAMFAPLNPVYMGYYGGFSK